MALEIGSENADSGMSQAIYQELDKLLSPPFLRAIDEAKDEEAKKTLMQALEDARTNSKKLSYALAKSIIEYITANIEIFGIQTQGDVKTMVNGRTAIANPGSHSHSVKLSVEQQEVLFTQSNDGTGHVR